MIDPTDPFGILTERRMPLLGRMERFMDEGAGFHSGHFPQPIHRESFADSVQTAWVRHYASGLAPAHDEAIALAVDHSGNVYVTGSSGGSGTGADYATVKYNLDGVPQWLTRYHGPGSGDDYATALAVDGSGNVYVTGTSEGTGTWHDYATIKYNPDGVQQWVARYDGPENWDDRATDLAVGGSGNIYVTGWSEGSGTGADYATIKYNPDGDQQWVARYNGPGYSDDYATALAVDGFGNVYVTGYSGLYPDYDYATVKYDSAGVAQWVVRYNGLVGDSHDKAKGLAVDGSGNVYVTGESYGPGTGGDYATVKYDSDGVQGWVARYSGPVNSWDWATGLAVDGWGNVYVTGESEGLSWAIYSRIKYVETSVSVESRGDVNGDRSVNVLDVVAAIRHILAIQTLVGDALWRADCNGDGQIDNLDVLGIVNVILGLGECDPAACRPELTPEARLQDARRHDLNNLWR
ncbi:MAG: SBBP repeat-containing protein [bacterium]